MSRPTVFDGQPALTAIVAAMDEELAPLRTLLAGRTPGYLPGVPLTFGRIGSAPVALLCTGDGARNARRGLANMLGQLPVRRVIVAGVSGGVTPDLPVGALVLGDRVVEAGDGSVRRADEALAETASRACHARRGIVVTAPRIAARPEDKERLRDLAARACAAGEGTPIAVDLESSIFVDEAARAGVPSVVVRAISDAAGESLPALLNRCRDEGGAIRRGRVLLGLLGDPRPLGQLLLLRQRVSACARELARAVALIVAALEPASLPVPAGGPQRRLDVVGTEA
jgi:adenosylhomocysteine nucleosidase